LLLDRLLLLLELVVQILDHLRRWPAGLAVLRIQLRLDLVALLNQLVLFCLGLHIGGAAAELRRWLRWQRSAIGWRNRHCGGRPSLAGRVVARRSADRRVAVELVGPGALFLGHRLGLAA